MSFKLDTRTSMISHPSLYQLKTIFDGLFCFVWNDKRTQAVREFLSEVKFMCGYKTVK